MPVPKARIPSVHVDPQQLLDFLIASFNRVGLKLIDWRGPGLATPSPGGTNKAVALELRAVIRENGSWIAVPLEESVEECDDRGNVGFSNCFGFDSSGKHVHCHQDVAVAPSRPRIGSHNVHGDDVHRPFRSVWSLSSDWPGTSLDGVANLAPTEVGPDVVVHRRPVVVFPDGAEFRRLRDVRLTLRRGVLRGPGYVGRLEPRGVVGRRSRVYRGTRSGPDIVVEKCCLLPCVSLLPPAGVPISVALRRRQGPAVVLPILFGTG